MRCGAKPQWAGRAASIKPKIRAGKLRVPIPNTMCVFVARARIAASHHRVLAIWGQLTRCWPAALPSCCPTAGRSARTALAERQGRGGVRVPLADLTAVAIREAHIPQNGCETHCYSATRGSRPCLSDGCFADGEPCVPSTHRWAAPRTWRWPTSHRLAPEPLVPLEASGTGEERVAPPWERGQVSAVPPSVAYMSRCTPATPAPGHPWPHRHRNRAVSDNDVGRQHLRCPGEGGVGAAGT